MSGIGFVIPNADFSNSPLGTVTIEFTNAEKAAKITEDYAEAIGTSAYNSAINSMVKDLLDYNLWEKTYALWPILGNNLNAMKVNIKNVTVPMQLMTNASAGINCINFADTISVGTPVIETDIKLEFAQAQQRSVVYRAISTNKPTRLNSIIIVKRTTSASPDRTFSSRFQSSLALTANSLSARIAYTQDGNNANIYKDGSIVNSVSATWSASLADMNTLFGGTGNPTSGEEGTTIPASDELFNGNLYYCLFGHYTNEELIVVDNIMAAFENAVGKV